MNIGKKFLKLVHCLFPKHHKMSKMSSYSYCKSLDQSSFPTIKELSNQPLINMHAIVEIKPNGCPLVNKCLTTKIVYKTVLSALSKPNKNISVSQKLY